MGWSIPGVVSVKASVALRLPWVLAERKWGELGTRTDGESDGKSLPRRKLGVG